MLLRRAIATVSLLGITAMGLVSRFQLGLIGHLPDPPLEGFDSDGVNASDTAYATGMPDSPLSITAHAVNLSLAAAGAPDRAETQPWLPIAASLAAAPAAVTSAGYLFYQMPVGEKKWCPYCMVDALMHIATFGFTLWEMKKAFARLARG